MATGAVLIGLVVILRPDWQATVLSAFGSGAFIAGFFLALASLRNPASVSPAIIRCGQYLASQPPGKRYLALTAGGHVFGLILNYGAISLLGGLVESIAARETNPEIREIRNRRMLLAIQRGFCATLSWSPLAFAMAIATTLIPGASWAASAPLALLHGVLIAFIGWALDTLYKPKLTGPRPPRAASQGDWHDLKPLVVLLAILFVGVGVLELVSGQRVIAVVLLFVPLLSIGWIVLQSRGGLVAGEEGGDGSARRRIAGFVLREAPGYQSELVLLIMAGVIGTVGADLLVPALGGFTDALTGVPSWIVLASLVWIVPLMGQLGMNPILAVSLLAPILPSPEALDVPPSVVVAALTAGWAMSGASSPFTATTLMIARLGHTSALNIGIGWNRGFLIACIVTLSASVAAFSVLL